MSKKGIKEDEDREDWHPGKCPECGAPDDDCICEVDDDLDDSNEDIMSTGDF